MSTDFTLLFCVSVVTEGPAHHQLKLTDFQSAGRLAAFASNSQHRLLVQSGCTLLQCLHFVAFLHSSIHALCFAAAPSVLLFAADIAANATVAAGLAMLSLLALMSASSCLVCHLVRFSTSLLLRLRIPLSFCVLMHVLLPLQTLYLGGGLWLIQCTSKSSDCPMSCLLQVVLPIRGWQACNLQHL